MGPLSLSATSQSGSHFYTVQGGVDPEITIFVPGSLEVYMYGRTYDPGKGPYHPRVPLRSGTAANQ